MKAILLAGGSGTRLRPITAELPKPMVSLFDRPVLEHILLHLRRNGITEVGITVHYLSEAIERAFGDGRELGMHLSWFHEKEPLGTAGAVRACKPFWDAEEDFLVLSGDGVCDYDLNAAVQFHRQQKAAATLLLAATTVPTEYGLVLTREDGTITRFMEKPGWGQVFTNKISTGIYVLTPEAMEAAPADGNCDFARDLFPTLLSDGKKLMGYAPYGYWKDIGSCDAYLEALRDALDGKWRMDFGVPQVSGGIWSASEIPENVTVLPPCYIGENVTLGEQALIGPHTVLEKGTSIDARAVIQGSAVLRASVGAGAALEKAILCPGAVVQSGAVLGRSTVVGAGAGIEQNVILRPGVRIWPGLRVAAGARLNASLASGDGPGQLLFEDDGTITGQAGLELNPEQLVAIGSLLGEERRVGLGAYGGSAANALMLAAGAGIAAAGGTAVVHDATASGSAAWTAQRCGLSVSLFISQLGDMITLQLIDRQGLPLSRSRQRKLENSLLRSEVRRACAGQMGGQELCEGMDDAYLSAAIHASGSGPLRPLSLRVPDTTPANRLLSRAMTAMGMEVSPKEGKLFFALAEGTSKLYAADEDGRTVSPQQLELLVMLLLIEQGEHTFSLPASAPAAAEELAKSFGCKILWLDRDGSAAAELAGEQWALRDGIFAACRIVHALSRSGASLRELVSRLPGCVLRTTEVELSSSRGSMMEALHRAYPNAENLGAGIRIRMGNGSVYLAPRNRYSALRIAAEAVSAEAAEELCDMMRQQTQKLDHAGLE